MGLSVYMYPWDGQVVVCIISLGVGGLYVAYPYMGAMRRPDLRDRRGEIHTPTSFLFPKVLAVDKMAYMTGRGVSANTFVVSILKY